MSERFEDPSRWDYIAASLAWIDGTFPFEAVHEARAYWPELREHFLAELVRAVADPESAMDEDSALPMYAMFLAAEKRDAAFAPALFDLLDLSADQIDGLMGEFSLTESVGRCLASVLRGDEAPIRAVALDQSRDILVRLAAIQALVVRGIEGDSTSDDVAAFAFALAQSTAVCLRTASPSRRHPWQDGDDEFFFNSLLLTSSVISNIFSALKFLRTDRPLPL